MRFAGKLGFILGAGAFCAVVATVISSILFVGWALSQESGVRNGALSAVPIVALFAAIPAGSFGFVCGIVGGFWLWMRNGRFGSLQRMLIEALLIGFFLSLLFPLFHWTIGWGLERNWFAVGGFLFSLGVGCPTAVLCALYLGSPSLDTKAGT